MPWRQDLGKVWAGCCLGAKASEDFWKRVVLVPFASSEMEKKQNLQTLSRKGRSTTKLTVQLFKFARYFSSHLSRRRIESQFWYGVIPPFISRGESWTFQHEIQLLQLPPQLGSNAGIPVWIALLWMSTGIGPRALLCGAGEFRLPYLGK